MLRAVIAILLPVLGLIVAPARAQTVPPDPPAVPVANLDEAFARLQTYALGQDYAPCKYIGEQVLAAQGHLDQRNALADRLAQVLTSGAPMDAKVFASQKLYLIATEQQVDALAPLLTDETLGDLARYAIEQIPGEKVTNALLAALDKATGKARIGIVNSLGARKDAAATKYFIPLLKLESADLTLALLQAIVEFRQADISGILPNIGGVLLLRKGYCYGAYPPMIWMVQDDKVNAYSRHVDLATMLDDPVLTGALISAMLRTRDTRTLTAIEATVAHASYRIRRLGVGFSARVERADDKILSQLSSTKGDTKAGLLYALAVRPDLKSDDLDTHSALSAALKDPDQPVRVAALAALAHVGDALALGEILKFAVTAEGADRKVAVEALATMQDRDIETWRKNPRVADVITQRLHEIATTASHDRGADYWDTDGLTPEERERRHQTARVLAINALAARYATGTYSSMIFLAQDKNPGVATAAIDAIGDLATDDYLVDALVLLNDETDPARRVQLEDTIVKALHRLGTAGGAARNLVRVLDLTPSAAMKESVRKIMGELGMPLPAASPS